MASLCGDMLAEGCRKLKRRPIGLTAKSTTRWTKAPPVIGRRFRLCYAGSERFLSFNNRPSPPSNTVRSEVGVSLSTERFLLRSLRGALTEQYLRRAAVPPHRGPVGFNPALSSLDGLMDLNGVKGAGVFDAPRSSSQKPHYHEHEPCTERHTPRPSWDRALLLHFRLDVSEL